MECAEQKVTLEISIWLLHSRPLVIEGDGVGAVVGVTGHRQRGRSRTERRQTHRGHPLRVLPQGGFFDLHDLARLERPGVEWPLDRPPG